jgi:CSLREA domain-containing protein
MKSLCSVSRQALTRIVSTIALAIMAFLFLSASASAANTYTVGSYLDDATPQPCLSGAVAQGIPYPTTGTGYFCSTLRDAVFYARSSDVIDLTNLNGTIDTTSNGAMQFSGSVIKGPGAALLSINGEVDVFLPATISGMTLPSISSQDSLTATNMVIGTLTTSGSATITNSSFLGSGTGISAAGQSTTVINCTFSESVGIYAHGLSLSVTNSTFLGNSSAALYAVGGTVNLTNSIISGSSGAQYAAVDNVNAAATMIENNNLFFNNAGGDYSGFTPSATDMFGKDPLLPPVGFYGGPTQSTLPLSASPAICGGVASALPAGTATDQRGFPITGSQCASGAVTLGSVQPNYLIVNTTGDTDDGLCGATCSLRDAIKAANAATPGSDIGFSSSLNGGTIPLGSPLPAITAQVNIMGPGANSLTVSGAGTYQVFNISSGGGVAIYGLTVANGSAGSGGGAVNSGYLQVANSTFSGNAGSAISNNASGVLNVTGTTFAGNSGPGGGGGAISNSGTLSVSNSTFSANNNHLAGPNAGAILNSAGAALSVTNSSFSGNSGSPASSIFIDASSANGQAGINNSIFTGNIGTAIDVFGSGKTISESNDLFYNNGIDSQGLTLSATDLIGKDPKLAPLGNYGGSTQTLLPLPGSPAMCGGNPALVPTSVFVDQRGFSRTTLVTGNTQCLDIGAVQANYQSIQFTNAAGGYTSTAANKAATPAPNVTVTENGQNIGGVPVTLTFSGTGNPAGLGPVTTIAGAGATFAAVTADSPGTDSLSATLNVTPAISLTTSPAATLNVNGIVTSTVSASTSSGSAPFGTALTFTATVPPAAGRGTSTGTVTFVNGATSLAGCTLSGGSCMAGYSALPAGSYTITANYSGDTNYAPATGGFSQAITQAAPVVVTWPTASPITAGQPLSASTLTGGSASVDGKFDWTTPAAQPAVDTHPESVTFTPTDAMDYSTVTGTVNVTVNPPNLVVTVSSDDAGTASNCTAQAAPGHGTDASCSLRDAVLKSAAANGGNISFASTVFNKPTTITLLSLAPLAVSSNTTITGATSTSVLPFGGTSITNLVTVDGNGAPAAFTVAAGVTGTSISNLIIQNTGTSGSGISGINNSGTLTLNAVSTSNSGSTSNSASGIVNSGTLTMTASTVSGNCCGTNIVSNGPSQVVGGGILNNGGTVKLAYDTISGNSAMGNGGGIFTHGGGSLSIADSTISSNQADYHQLGAGYDGGIAVDPNDPSTVVLANTILSGNSTGDASDPFPNHIGDYGGPQYTDGGGNVIGAVVIATPIAGSTGFSTTHSVVNSNPINLNPLVIWPGPSPTPTMLPLPGSPAICAGLQSNIPSGQTTDQGGLPNTTSYTGHPICVDAGALQTKYTMGFGGEPGYADIVSGEPPASSPVNTAFAAFVEISEANGFFGMSGLSIPLTLNAASGTLTGGLAATSNGKANYTLQVNSVGTGDTLTANLTLNGGLNPPVVLSATSTPFNITPITPTTVTVTCPPSVTYNGAAQTPCTAVATAADGFSQPLTVTYSSDTTDVGTVTASASFAGNAIYGASSSSTTFAIIPANYVVTVSSDDAGTAFNCTPQSTPGHGTDASCSLRDALLQAAATGGGNISFDATAFRGPTTITIVNGTLSLPDATTISGPQGAGANLVTVSGGNTFGVFYVLPSATVSLSGLTIANGNTVALSPGSGGLYVGSSANLTVANSTISGNIAQSGGGIYIDTSGTLTLTNCTLSNNTAAGAGGQGGGIYNNNGTVFLNNSTLSGNTANDMGGGIINGGVLTLTNSTVSGNSAGTGGGIAVLGALTLANSIVAGNSASASFADISNAYTDSGGNQASLNASNLSNIIINLAPLGNYGGPTQTMPPLPGSPAICAGTPANIPPGKTGDQRGFPNNTSYTIGSSTELCVDSGAVQTNFALSFSGEPPASSTAGANFAASVTLTESGSPFAPAVTIPLTLTGSGTLTGGSATTSSGIANYTLQVSSAGTGDSLTANLTLNGVLTPPLAISATSTSFDITAGLIASTVNINCTPGATYNGAAQTPCTATATGAGGLSQNLTVTYANNIDAGSASASASFAGNSIYGPSSNSVNFTISPATPIVTWPTASPINYGQTLGASQLTGGSDSAPGGFAWTVPATIPPIGTDPESVTFASASTNYSSVTGTVNVTVNPANYVVTVSSDDAGTASNCTPQSTAGHGTDPSCSLRDAVLQAAAGGGGNISFDATTFNKPTTITLSNGTLTVPTNTSIVGATSGTGATLTNLVAVDGNNATTVIKVPSGTAAISHLIIQHGNNSVSGGGIFNSGNLTLDSDSIVNNKGTIGGGIYNGGTLLLTSSTVSSNTAVLTTSTINAGGGIANFGGTLTLIGDTISNNAAGSYGGGIANAVGINVPGVAGPLSIFDSTISGNSASTVGPGYGNGIGGPANVIANSIISGNAGDDISGGTYTDGGGNLIGVVNATTVNPAAINLAPLGNYGGPTQTMLPLPGSPAICAGLQNKIPSGRTTDQRGLPNTVSYPGYSTCVDSGAAQSNYQSAQFTNSGTGYVGIVSQALNPAPVVSITENGQNIAGIPVTLVFSGTGIASGLGPVTTVAGTGATFSSLSVNAAGSDTLSISIPVVGSLSLSGSAGLTISPGAPTVASVSPSQGPANGGTVVTITGTNLVSPATVKFGTVAATNVAVNSGVITATSPAGTSTVNVTVTTAAGTSATSSADQFTYLGVPTVTAVIPNQGPPTGGTVVTITGTSFTSTATVTFGTVPATNVKLVNGTTITATAPVGTGTVNLRVTTSLGTSATSSADLFTYLGVPTVSKVTPAQGPLAGGTAVTIAGTNFASPATVMFGTTPATNIAVVSGSKITAIAPAGTGTVNVTVGTAGGTSAISSADQYNYLAPPAVSAISPNQGPLAGGIAVTITGTNFASPATVTFGTAAATKVTVVNPTTITATAPAGTGTVNVTVSTPGGVSPISSTDQFSYVSAPIVSAVSPNQGPKTGGTAVTITGANFMLPLTVKFGTTQALSVQLVNSTTITATSPPGTGAVHVTVVTPGKTSATSTNDLFTYLGVPTVSKVSPNAGPLAGGTAVTITGSNFASPVTVMFGTAAASNVAVVSGSKITATAPAGAGTVNVMVTTAGGTSGTSLVDQFTYLGLPAVSKVSPNLGSPAGGTAVTITGTNFASPATVTFGTAAATKVVVVNPTTITATSPAGTGAVNVTVTTPGGTSATSSLDLFTY